MDIGRITIALASVRMTECRRIRDDPKLNIYTAEIVANEVEAAFRSAANYITQMHLQDVNEGRE
jgi:hypothetical protein